MLATIGDFIQTLPPHQGQITLEYFPHLRHQSDSGWEQVHLTADFTARYLASNFKGYEPLHRSQQARIKKATDYIVNELFENAIMYSDKSADYPIRFSVNVYNHYIIYCLTNSIPPTHVADFQTFLHQFLHYNDTQQWLAKFANKTQSGSGLGLVIMRKEYRIKLGWQFKVIQKNPEIITVTTMVQLAV